MLKTIADTYPQLYLDPDKADIEEYKACVRKGERPAECGLSHFVMDERDRIETVDTPAGTAQVIILHERHDFEIFVRCMMAARRGPLDQIPPTMGASTIVAFNWPKINAHKAAFFEEQAAAGVLMPDWGAEFKRFTAVKENYQDLLIVLSCGPYSNVSSEQVNEILTALGHEALSDEAWREASGRIRKYHELTHFVCRKLYPDKIDEIWDELVADAAGIYGAFGEYSLELEELFLGITDGKYTGGRLENYTADGTDLDELSAHIDSALREFDIMISTRGISGDGSEVDKDIFDCMLMLEDTYDHLGTLL